jgi:phosphoglycerol transferase MdoB-like AlkP superfamily enzyme
MKTQHLFNTHSRMMLLAYMWLPVLALFMLLRVGLTLWHVQDLDLGVLSLGDILFKGLIYDLSFYGYACLPFLLYCWLVPQYIWQQTWHKVLVHSFAFLTLYGLGFIILAEMTFWQEFSVRFNFISVDYLVYRREVTDNINESYPILAMVLGILPLAVILYLWMNKFINRALNSQQAFLSRSQFSAVFLILPLLSFAFVSQNLRENEQNVYQREIASNGPFQFFAAFRNNQLDFNQFYHTLPDAQASAVLRASIKEDNAQFISDELYSIGRFINNPKPERHHNIVLISVESLSARYLSQFGNQDGITPNLDELTQNSVFFNNLYATGTRTARGLEAITLSIPPTPGRSIVKRIGRESGMWSIGNVLKDKGYEVRYLYGGRGYFDNMNAFFSGNGYEITDQSSIDNADIHFENAWGVSDGDLYQQTIKQANLSHQQGKPFFYHVMTTSNHRPYTYPDDQIDIPSGTGRSGAVKYTDFAIGEFLDNARKQAWFDNTIFVIVADHCASSAGKTDLPVERYHIPMWIYAPGIVQTKSVNTLASQIDIAPTLLGMLNMSYESWSFGKDILTMKADDERIMIGTYQKLGYLKQDELVILSPGKKVTKHELGNNEGIINEPLTEKNLDAASLKAIAYYQGADYIYKHGLNKWQPHATPLKLSQAQ